MNDSWIKRTSTSHTMLGQPSSSPTRLLVCEKHSCATSSLSLLILALVVLLSNVKYTHCDNHNSKSINNHDNQELAFLMRPESLFDRRLASRSLSELKSKEQLEEGSRARRTKRSAAAATATSTPITTSNINSNSNSNLNERLSQVQDACPSRMEIITPFYATNAKGKLRTLVHSELMQQAIQVETCQTTR